MLTEQNFQPLATLPPESILRDIEGVVKDAQKALKRLGRQGTAFIYVDNTGKEWALTIEQDNVNIVEASLL